MSFLPCFTDYAKAVGAIMIWHLQVYYTFKYDSIQLRFVPRKPASDLHGFLGGVFQGIFMQVSRTVQIVEIVAETLSYANRAS